MLRRRVARPIIFVLLQRVPRPSFAWASVFLRYKGRRPLALLPFQHSEFPEQVFGGVPLNPGIFKVAVVGPDWNLELDGKG